MIWNRPVLSAHANPRAEASVLEKNRSRAVMPLL